MTHLEREGWWATKQVVMSLSKSWCWINSLIEQSLSLIYKADGVPEMAVAAMPAQLGTEWTNLNSHLMFSCFFHPRCQTRVAALLIILAANHPALPALCMSIGNQKSWIPVWGTLLKFHTGKASGTTFSLPLANFMWFLAIQTHKYLFYHFQSAFNHSKNFCFYSIHIIFTATLSDSQLSISQQPYEEWSSFYPHFAIGWL